MRIKSIQAFPLAYPEPHYKGIERYITLARVEDDDGRVGWGECISQFREASRATKTIIDEGFAPLLVGEDALGVPGEFPGCLGARGDRHPCLFHAQSTLRVAFGGRYPA